MFGPGVTAISRAAPAKMMNWDVEIIGQSAVALLCSLTFELSRDRQTGAWPARLMMHCAAAPAKCTAVGARPE